MRIETFEHMKVKSGGKLVEAGQARGGVLFFVAKAITQSFAERGKAPPQGLRGMLMAAQQGALPEEQVLSHVSHGRWVVSCPSCSHASMYSADVPVYICPIHEVWSAVVIPADWHELEAELSLRPVDDPAAGNTKANWTPGETPADIKMENALHFYGRGNEHMNAWYTAEHKAIEEAMRGTA